MQITFLAHCSGTQCAPQVCSAQLSRTVLAHNVRRKFAAHSCRALYWHTMCAESMQRTVVAHYSGTQCAPQVCSALLLHTILVCLNFAARSCRALRCSALLPPPAPTPSLSPPLPYFFLVPYPKGECEKKCWGGRSVTKNKNLGVGWEKCRGGGMVGVILKIKIWGWGGSF